MAETNFFYANGAEMALTAYDVTMKFLRNGTATSNVGSPSAVTSGKHEIVPLVLDTMSVAMSPSHAKTVVASMLHLLREYEAQYGAIPLSPETSEKWRSEIALLHSDK